MVDAEEARPQLSDVTIQWDSHHPGAETATNKWHNRRHLNGWNLRVRRSDGE